MAGTNQQYQRTGSFVPTTQIWEQSQIQSVNVNSPEFKNLLVRLYQNINKIALVLNTKETGAYYEQEFVTGSLLYPPPANSLSAIAPLAPVQPVERQISRKVVNFGALPAAGTKSVPHNLEIGVQWSFLKIYGCATNPSLFTTPPTPFGVPPLGMNYIPLPFVSVRDATGDLELSVDQVNVNITTGGTDYSDWTITYVILEWVTL